MLAGPFTIPMAIALAISTTYVVLLYFLTHIWGTPTIRAMFLEEVREFLRTLIFLLLGGTSVYLLFIAFSLFLTPDYRQAMDLVTQPIPLIYAKARSLAERFLNAGMNIFLSFSVSHLYLILLGTVLDRYVKFAYSIVFLFTPLKPMLQFIQRIIVVLQHIVVFVGFFGSEAKLLPIVEEYITFGLLVPLGIFLRTFPATRRLGSSLITVGLSLYVALPASFVFMEPVYDTYESIVEIRAEDVDVSGLAPLLNVQPSQGNSEPISSTEIQEFLENPDYYVFGEDETHAFFGEQEAQERAREEQEAKEHFLKKAWRKIREWGGMLVGFITHGIPLLLDQLEKLGKNFADVKQATYILITASLLPHVINQFTIPTLLKIAWKTSVYVAFSLITILVQAILLVAVYRSLATLYDGIDYVFGLAKLGVV